MISRVRVCAPPKVQKILSSSMNLSPLRNNYYTTVVDRIPFLSDPFISVCFVEIVINCFRYILASHIFFYFQRHSVFLVLPKLTVITSVSKHIYFICILYIVSFKIMKYHHFFKPFGL